jgi:haloalkane dehalogenase
MDCWRSHYPFSSHHLDANGWRLHYLDEGRGEAVVMLHGNPTWSFYYRHLVCDLRNHGLRAVAPDHLGCGLSDKPEPYPYCLATHVANLERLLDLELQLPRLSLVVHDWGGAIGMGYAVRHPEKVARIVVLNTAAFLDRTCPWRIRVCRWPLLGELLIRVGNGFARGALWMATARPRSAWSATVRQGYLAPYDSYRSRVGTLAFVRDIPLQPRHPTWQTVAEIDRGLCRLQDKPMLICWGMQDFCFTERFLRGWQSRFPHAEIHRFPDAGHYVLEDAADRIVPLVRRFLSRGEQSG